MKCQNFLNFLNYDYDKTKKGTRVKIHSNTFRNQKPCMIYYGKSKYIKYSFKGESPVLYLAALSKASLKRK